VGMYESKDGLKLVTAAKGDGTATIMLFRGDDGSTFPPVRAIGINLDRDTAIRIATELLDLVAAGHAPHGEGSS